MPRKTFRLDNILNGFSPTQFGPQPSGTYDQAFGIDPDALTAASNKRTGGVISPVAYSKFSSTELTSTPMWITTTPKDQNTYVYGSGGIFVKYDSTLTSAGSTSIGTPTSGAGNGMAYYNNYIYLATPVNVSRYGPLDNSPSLTNTWWTGASCLNDATKVLKDTTYPTIRQKALPNHAMKVHVDGFLYFCDVISNTYGTTAVQGKGVIHRIGTKKTTDEGDTNNGSAYDVLELPFGFLPVGLETYGNDLAIVANTFGSSQSIRQGRTALFLWDTFASIPYKQINIPDPIVSAIYNNNGRLYVFSGNTTNGVRVSVYDGGDTLRQIAFFEEGNAPFQGAVDAFEDKLLFGGFMTYFGGEHCVAYSLGSKNSELPDVIHCPIVTSNLGVLPVVTALKYVQQSSNIRPIAVVGWVDNTTSGLDKFDGSGTLLSRFRFKIDVGRPFSLVSVRMPMDRTVTSATDINVTAFYDSASNSVAFTEVNNTNYSGDQVIAWKRPEIVVNGSQWVMLDFAWSGTRPNALLLPIEVDIDINENIKPA